MTFNVTFNEESLYIIRDVELNICNLPIYNYCQVQSYIHDSSKSSQAIEIRKNGVLVNMYLFYPATDGSGKIDSIAIYGSYLQEFYNMIRSDGMIFGMNVKTIYLDIDSALENFLAIYVDY